MHFPEHGGRAQALTDAAGNLLQGVKRWGGEDACVNPSWVQGVFEEQCTRSSADFKRIYIFIKSVAIGSWLFPYCVSLAGNF